jgi:translocation and assembly module TamA
MGVSLVLMGWGLAAGPLVVPAQGQSTPAGPPVVRVELRGLDRLDPPLSPPRRLPLRPGVPFTPERREATRDAVLRALAERSRPYARVEMDLEPDPASEGVVVVVEVAEVGPPVRFGTVQVEAVPPLREEDVAPRIAFAPGDPYRPSLMEATLDRLRLLPVVEDAVVVPEGLAWGDTLVRTVVSAAPVDRVRGPALEGVLSSFRCLELAGYWRDRHLLGTPRALDLGVGFGNLLAGTLAGGFPCGGTAEDETGRTDYFARGELLLPLERDPRAVLSLRAFAHRASEPWSFVLRGGGAEVELRRLLRRHLFAAGSFRVERVEVEAAEAFLCASFGACTVGEMRALAGPSRLAPLSLSLSWMPPVTRAHRVLEGPGWRERTEVAPPPDTWWPWTRLSAEGAGRLTGSQHGFLRVVAEGAAAWPWGSGREVAARLRMGGVVGGGRGLPPQLGLFSGGVNSVRGVEQNLLGGGVVLVEPEELDALGCAPELGGCPPGTVIRPPLGRARPTAGSGVLEASLEGRLRMTRRTQMAGFLDGGLIRIRAADLVEGTGDTRWRFAVTPGVGVRARTPVGPLRVDLGFDPGSPRVMPAVSGLDGAGGLLFLGDVTWDPYTFDDPSTLREVWRRIRIGVAMGQPF